MDWGSLLSYAVAIVALLAAGGVGLQRSRVTGLRGDLDDEGKRNQRLSARVDELEKSDARKSAIIAEFKIKLQHAEAMAMGEQHWKALDDHQEQHHREAVAHWSEERKMWARMEQHLDSLGDQS